RWFLLCICWSTYILYRSVVVGQMKYERNSRMMVIRPRNIWMIRIALFLKILIFLYHYLGVNYILAAVYPFINNQTNAKQKRFLEIFLEAVSIYIAIWNICRLYTWLRSPSWNRSFVLLVNRVFHLASLVEGTSLPHPLEGFVLLLIYVVQFKLTLIQFINYIRGGTELLVINIILLDIFYNAYIAYLFLVLSWIASFNGFLEVSNERIYKPFVFTTADFQNHRMMGLSILQQRQKILQLLDLYSRINNGHQDIVALWPLASVLISSVVTMVGHWAAIIYIALFNHDLDTAGKWNWVGKWHLGGGLAPLLRILLIGLCNDRLAQLDRYLSLQLLFI
ncbi:hypothetical protein KR038_001368, partial [Drosophila bunnanda]